MKILSNPIVFNKAFINQNNQVVKTQETAGNIDLPNMQSYVAMQINFGQRFSENIDIKRSKMQKMFALHNNLQDFSPFKNAETNDCKAFLTKVETNSDDIIMFATGKKPAVLLHWENHSDEDNSQGMSLCEKIFTSDKYYVTPWGDMESDFFNVLVVDKDLAKERIAQEKDLFTSRLNIDKTSSEDEIFEKIENDDYFFDDNEDLLGVTLGFSASDCVIYNLDLISRENEMHDFSMQISPEIKNNWKTVLNDKKSPYKNMDDKFKLGICKKIDLVKDRKFVSDFIPNSGGYSSIIFNEEGSERDLKRIDSAVFESYQVLMNVPSPNDVSEFLSDNSVRNFFVQKAAQSLKSNR